MKNQYGFKELLRRTVPEAGAEARIYEHALTGARLLSMVTKDENKVFGINFRTPPQNSTGLPHILEHSVLCGSAKYPVKEPFVELLKGSLQTFLNAMTFPDKTCYPVGSANLQDFYNLVDVYLDAVFHPRLTADVLRQEGWRYELASPRASLEYKGVVYGEMKGAYSSPDSLLSEYSQHALFPDTPYGLDSGGDPERIPDLTFEQFEAFHHSRYHPSNAWTFFYGDDDPERRLEILDAYFSNYIHSAAATAVPLQPPFAAPVRLEFPYAAGETGDGARGYCTVNYALPEATDVETNLALQVLEHILIGLPSSRLRQALMASGLGEDLAGVGLENELRQLYFSVGLKGMNPTDADMVEALITDTLAEMAQGIAPRDIEAALNTVEFDLRENNTGSYPRGLSIMLRALSTWLHGGDPLALVAFEAPLHTLKDRVARGEPVFEDLLRRHFLNNPHRARVVLTPDPTLGETIRQRELDRLQTVRQGLDAEQLRSLAAETRAQKKRREAPDAPEALATIPRLRLSDLPRWNQRIPLEVYKRGESLTLFHELPTNGLVYLDLGFDLRRVPDRLLPLVPVFGRALIEMGSAKEDYAELLNRVARKTGGVEPQTLALPVRDSEESACKLFLRGKATREHARELVDILMDMVFMTAFDNPERFSQIVSEAKARAEERLIPGGHGAVAARLRARARQGGVHTAYLVAEQLSGLSQLLALRELSVRLDTDYASVLDDLNEIRACLLCMDALMINLTAEGSGFEAVLPELTRFIHALPKFCRPRAQRGIPEFTEREALLVPAQVGYVGKGVRLAALTEGGIPAPLAALAVTKYLSNGYLWDRVRVQGGAYGAFCLYDRLAQTLAFVSYRDPNLDATLEAYDKAGGYLRRLKLSKDELEKSIIGAIGEMDTYLLPDAKGFTSMVRFMTGEDEEYRQQLREAVLGCTEKDFHLFADAAAALAEKGHVVYLGPESALKGSKLEFERTRAL